MEKKEVMRKTASSHRTSLTPCRLRFWKMRFTWCVRMPFRSSAVTESVKARTNELFADIL